MVKNQHPKGLTSERIQFPDCNELKNIGALDGRRLIKVGAKRFPIVVKKLDFYPLTVFDAVC